MNVLHVSTAMTWRGGEGQIASLLEESLRLNVGAGLYAAAGSAMERYAGEKGIPTFSFRKRSSFDLPAARRLARTVRKGKFDLIHTHDSHAHTLAVLSASLFGNPLPILVSRRVDFPISTGLLGRWKYRHPNVRGYVCVSGAIRQVMLQGVIPSGLLHIVRSGIDLGKFEGRGDGRLRREFGIPDDLPLIGNVSAIAPHKDYPTFVRTAERFLRGGGRGKFLIVGGDSGEEKAVRSLVRELGLEDHIIFTGFRTDVPDILPELDLFLITSRTEGLGTTILDAFAAGVPVAATAGGGIPELVEHEVTGLLADPGDDRVLAGYLERLLRDDELRGRLIRNGRARVREFSKERTAERTVEIYGKVVGDR